MIEGLKPYGEYRESPVPWAKILPAHWKTERAKWLFTKMDRPVRPGDGVVTCFRDGMVTLRKNRRLRGFTEAIYEFGYQGIRKGDLVIHAMDAFAGAIGVSDSDGKGTPVYLVCQPRPNINPHFFAVVVREMARTQWIQALSRGIRERSTDFRYDTFGGEVVPLPPPEEQAAIVRFLDHANQRIDRFIRSKKKIIALLNEQKQAIIHRAVTLGIDPDVKVKDSGIPWLGEIPEHWELKRLKFLASINCGQVDPRDSIYRNMVLIAPNHIQSGNGKLIREESAFAQGAVSGKYLVMQGQIIYSKIRPNLRKATIAPCECLCSADMYPISSKNSELKAAYLLQLLLSNPFTKFAVDESMRVAMPKINRDALNNCWLWVPSLEEQRNILDFIAEKTSPFANSISRLEFEVKLIHEYRTRLIADVVTGKMDVREASRALPPSVEESLPELDSEGLEDESDLETEPTGATA